MTPDTFLENFGHLADAPNGVQKLRELILQLAVQGKLVLQNPNDEPALILLERIEAEKKRLVKERKIRKPKPIPKIPREDVPFQVPPTWEWTILSDIGQIVGGGTPSSKNPEYFSNDGIPWLTPADLYKYGQKFISKGRRHISELGLEKSSAQLMPKGTVLFSSRAPIGYVAIAADSISTNQGFKSCVPYIGGMSEYIYWFLKSAAAEIDRKAPGTTFREVSGKIVGKVLLPLPPLEEQKRIVAKVDQLMALCDELEERQQKKRQGLVNLNNSALDAFLNAQNTEEFAKHWQRICDDFDLLYDHPETIGKLRSSILQLAVQGKLVPQDSDDEPVALMLERIKSKTQTVSRRKGKKQTTNQEVIINGEQPFELPIGWEWLKLSNLGETQTGTTPPKSNPEYFGGNIPFIKPGDLGSQGVFYAGESLSQIGIGKGRLIPKGSVLMVCIGGSIGKSDIVDKDVSCNQQINTITPFKPIDGRYLLIAMRAEYFQGLVLSRASVGTLPIISKSKWGQLPIPVPGEEEQKRIVDRVDLLMALCNELEQKLIQAQSQAEKYAAAVVTAITAA